VIEAQDFVNLKRRIEEAEDDTRKAFAKLRSYVATFEADYREAPKLVAVPPAIVEPAPPIPEPVVAVAVAPAVEEEQPSLFGDAELPVPESREPVQSIYVHFERLEDIEAFGNAIGVHLGVNTRAITFPPDDMFRKTIPALRLEVEAES
jgi:hypothetical protein